MAQLNREYDVQRTNLQTRCARREHEHGHRSAGHRRRAVPRHDRHGCPATVHPRSPVGAALLLSVGAALAAFMAAADADLHDSRTLREVTQRPVLGMVSQLPDPSMARRRRRGSVLFAGSVTGLFAMFAGVAAFALLTWRAIAS